MKARVPRPGRGMTVAALLGIFAGAAIVAILRRGARGAVTEAVKGVRKATDGDRR